MISKDEAKAKLRKAGYSIVDDNAVVTVLVSEKSNIKNIVKDVKEILVKAGYSASFGVRQTNSALEENTDSETDESSDVDDMSGAEVIDNVSDDIDIEADDDIEIIDDDIDKVEKKSTKKVKKTSKKKEEDFFDDEDDDSVESGSQINLDAFDMDMLLNEESVQFSLEDFGMM